MYEMTGMEIKKATPTLAKEFAEMPPIKGDRNLRPNRSAMIRKEVESGTFRTCEWASFTCAGDGITYRVNGKHTSNVLAAMNGSFPKNLRIVIERFKGDTIEDGARLYETFDTRAAMRSGSDINHAYAAANPLLDDVPLRLVSACVTGIAYNTYEEQLATNTNAGQRARACLTHGEFILFVNDLCHVSEKWPTHIARSAVIAAMYRSWLKSKSAAKEFWSLVRDGVGADPKAPERRLHLALHSCSISVGRGASDGKKGIGRREMFVKCIHGWNAWRRKESTDLRFISTAKTPSCV